MLTSTEELLRSLDVADSALSEQQQQRANETLLRILSSSVIPDGAAAVGAPQKRRRRVRKLVWVAAAAGGIGVASLMFPGIGGSGVSFASWTATPSPIAAADVQTVAQACREQVTDARGPGGSGIAGLATIPVVLAERRGDFVAMLLSQDNPQTSVSCVALQPPGSADVANVTAAVGGSDGPAVLPPSGQLRPGGISQFGGHFPASFTDGTVGANVVAVTIHAGSQSVKATVRGGRYVAWWPGKAFADGPLPPSGEGGPREILTYDLTLTDGTTQTSVAPYFTPPLNVNKS